MHLHLVDASRRALVSQATFSGDVIDKYSWIGVKSVYRWRSSLFQSS